MAAPPRPGLRTIERVVLLGFMGSGKSVVGSSLARRLEWGFLDFDREIEAREGRSIFELVEADGEEYLRVLERRLTEEFGREERLVLSPGGGWILQTNLLEWMRPGTLSVWLRASPAEIVQRLREAAHDRPLMDLPNPEEAIAGILSDREHLFSSADLQVATRSRSVEAIAFEIERVVRAER